MSTENKTTDIWALQAHYEVGGTACTFQDLYQHVRSREEEYYTKGGYVAGRLTER